MHMVLYDSVNSQAKLSKHQLPLAFLCPGGNARLPNATSLLTGTKEVHSTDHWQGTSSMLTSSSEQVLEACVLEACVK